MTMQAKQTSTAAHSATHPSPSRLQRFGDYMQDPLGSIVTASAAVIGSFGFVLSGMWFISLTVS
jgi:hypothetical protein